MYTSGQFSGMFRVSKKLLRHYNDIGLLVPSEINLVNGYHYYSQSQYEKMELILYLRSLQFPLAKIKQLLDMPEETWGEVLHQHLATMCADQRSLERVMSEIVSLENRIINGKGIFETMEKKTEFEINVFTLDKPICIVGRGARVKHGSPEHQPTIDALISGFFGDDVPSMIPNAKKPAMRFGICAEFIPETGEFTYMMGDQIEQSIDDSQLPETTRTYVISEGEYACVRFSRQDKKTLIAALGEGYDKLFGWVNESDWESAVLGVAYEVYKDERFEVPSYPEMEIWTPVKRKKTQNKHNAH